MKLVRESPPEHFRRVAIKPPAPVVQIAKVMTTTTEPAQVAEQRPRPEASDTLARLADLSANVRSMAGQFAALAAAIDDVALEVEDRIAAINADSEKLAKLRDLLGIGV